jgi:hypothetical protein
MSVDASPFAATLQIGNIRSFGAYWDTQSPAWGQAQIPGSNVIQLDGGAIMQIGSLENFGSDAETISFNSSTLPSNISLQSDLIWRNRMSPNSVVARFPNEQAGSSIFTVGNSMLSPEPPRGFQLTNLPPNGNGKGLYQQPSMTSMQ